MAAAEEPEETNSERSQPRTGCARHSTVFSGSPFGQSITRSAALDRVGIGRRGRPDGGGGFDSTHDATCTAQFMRLVPKQ
jgi:hypothetical protein